MRKAGEGPAPQSPPRSGTDTQKMPLRRNHFSLYLHYHSKNAFVQPGPSPAGATHGMAGEGAQARGAEASRCLEPLAEAGTCRAWPGLRRWG